MDPTPLLRVGSTPRELVGELMDDPALDPGEHARALTALGRLNRMSRTVAQLTPSLAALQRELGRPLRVLDVATGGGDVPLALQRWADRQRLPWEVAGCDVSEVAVRLARERAEQHGLRVRFFQADVLREPLEDHDAITCSLFLHHLREDDAVTLLGAFARAARLVLVSDLVRSPGGLAAAILATHLATRSRVARVDGPRSVRAAFTLDEARALAARADLAGATVQRAFPFRFLLTWRRP